MDEEHNEEEEGEEERGEDEAMEDSLEDEADDYADGDSSVSWRPECRSEVKTQPQCEVCAARHMSDQINVALRPDRIKKCEESMALWRLPENWSDWTIILGSQRYAVHRVHLASSDFFKGCFGFPAPETNLTEILPQLCHTIFDGILDYMYGEEITLKSETLPLFVKAAHVLQITDLLSKVLSAAPEITTNSNAPYVWTNYSDVSDVIVLATSATSATSGLYSDVNDMVCEIPMTWYLPDDLDPICTHTHNRYTYTYILVHMHTYMYIHIP